MAKNLLRGTGFCGNPTVWQVNSVATHLASLEADGVPSALAIKIMREALRTWLHPRAPIGQKYIDGLHDRLDTAVLAANVKETRRMLVAIVRQWAEKLQLENADFLGDPGTVTEVEPTF